ncbi:MAG: thioredoxin domain-containing protein [Deltaproteobacteria bacterium]|nr:thioredoxin domain-containing protein [Deltaproteobacteria bacterium]
MSNLQKEKSLQSGREWSFFYLKFKVSFFFLFVLTPQLPGCQDKYPVMTCDANSGVSFDQTDVPVIGPTDSKVDLTVFGDFQCPYTHLFWQDLEEYLQSIKDTPEEGKLSVHFRHFPLPGIHNRALEASTAGAAAYLQGNSYFWEMVPLLMTTGSKLTDDYLTYYAYFAGLDEDQFATDYSGEEAAALVARDRNLGQSLNIQGTPAVYLCGQKISVSNDEIIDNLDYLLDKN